MEIEIRNVSRRFQLRNMGVVALYNVSARFPSGKISVIYGPSGSGKSVLLNLIAGFDRPDEGYIRIDGTDITRLSWSDMNKFRRKYMSYCMQRNILIPRFKVGLNIALPLIIRGVDYDDALKKAYELAEKLGIEYTFDREAYTLSGGEQRRVILARALILDSKILLLDEPTSNMDEETADTVRNVILESYREAKNTVVISTHDPQLRSLGSVRLMLRDGKVNKIEVE